MKKHTAPLEPWEQKVHKNKRQHKRGRGIFPLSNNKIVLQIEIISNVTDYSIEHDPSRIKQVITNLIKNSLTAVEPEKGKIEISMKNMPQEIQISIKDNGVGIPLNKQRDLFKKFYQVDASLTREKGGSGLGLSICKGIMENHGGVISVKSTPNQETIFTFTLPKKTESGKSPIGLA